MKPFSNAELWLIFDALHVAADRYAEAADAAQSLAVDYRFRGIGSGPAINLAQDFEGKAGLARDLIERLTQSEWPTK